MVLATLTCVSCSASAETRSATPASLPVVLALSGSGDTIVLEPGSYANLRFRARRYDAPLVLDARKATLNGVFVTGVSGLTIRGGEFRLPAPTLSARTGAPDFGSALRMRQVSRVSVSEARFVGPGTDATHSKPQFGEGYGLVVDEGADIAIFDNAFQGLKAGVILRRNEGFRVVGNQFQNMRSDGIQAAESRSGLIESNSCQGTRIRDSEHPDCIQLWSRPPSPPTADIVIRGNRAEGHTQGIGMFNHIRNGVDDGGYDRILIEDNDIAISVPQGIALSAGRESVVRNNRVRTLSGAKYRASINVGALVKRCGNVVAPGAGKPGVKDKPC
jgi:nitrous oxidase accessory protein NosD